MKPNETIKLFYLNLYPSSMDDGSIDTLIDFFDFMMEVDHGDDALKQKLFSIFDSNKRKLISNFSIMQPLFRKSFEMNYVKTFHGLLSVMVASLDPYDPKKISFSDALEAFGIDDVTV